MTKQHAESSGDAREAMDRRHADTRTARLLVAAQFVLIALIVVLGGRDDWSVPTVLDRAASLGVLIGLVVMVVGAAALGRGLTAAPLPNAHARLRTGGLFRFVRHPIYSGLLLFAIAHTIASGSYVQVVLCLALIGLISVKARWEERRLAARFPGYADYCARTPRFVPFVRPPRTAVSPTNDLTPGDPHV